MRSSLKTAVSIVVLLASAFLSFGCSSQDVPQAHKGRMFDKTGALAFWSGGKGFEGPILGPGTYYTGIYPEVRMVQCSQSTVKESLSALTRDGVQFTLDIYIRFSANCDDDKSVEALLSRLSPAGTPPPPAPDKKDNAEHPADAHDADPRLTITSLQAYNTYVRPALGEAVRESVSPIIANDINPKREEIFGKIRERFNDIIGKQNPKLISIFDLNLSNLDFPDAMDKANTERAVQAILKDKAIAERERVTAEIETTQMRRKLAETEGDNEAARIDRIGAALRRNPEYLQFNMQTMMPGIYKEAGERGNLILAAPVPNLMLAPGQGGPKPAAPPPAAPAK